MKKNKKNQHQHQHLQQPITRSEPTNQTTTSRSTIQPTNSTDATRLMIHHHNSIKERREVWEREVWKEREGKKE